MSKYKTFLILHKVRSVQNTGSLFRTAECAGIDKIYLTGYTPAPIDRLGRKRSDFKKTALGAEDMIPWEKVKSLTTLLKKLKKDTFGIVGIEQSKDSKDYKKFELKGNTVFIVGNEVSGLSKAELKLMDECIEIPLKGNKESLNVSVAAGIVLFRVMNI